MAKFDLIMPKLGESIIEATITKWLKVEGDIVEEDDAILEIATDKVDSEIPSPVEGKIIKLMFKEGDVVPVGEIIAQIEMDGAANTETEINSEQKSKDKPSVPSVKIESTTPEVVQAEPKAEDNFTTTDRFYSPLVKSIAKTEGIGIRELESIQGSGKDGRVTKQDILAFLKNKVTSPATKVVEAPAVIASGGDQIIEMDRMRRLIADHMVMSKQVSPHVTSFIDVDVTTIVNWRNKVKDILLKREGEKITFTPIFIDAAAKAIKDYPGINASVDGTKIIIRKNVNIGMAAALPNGNLIVPVIKHADEKNLLGLSKTVNDLANRARSNKLLPDEIQGGTFTVTNFGSFDSLTGTPIINQPQVAILGIGAIRKQPVVIESPLGDTIGIRSIMIFSLAYDHRVVDGALAGMYLKRLKELLENFDPNLPI
ncbi:MAG: diapophytoene dehydrogenase [Bacteroidetes bacterium HGW-Bacteroidetes-17]|jgi:2-oxoglutarate dehydrogenase E2 component (dihydrolipoamide succinyltransferase)|nr:MAG: diapophytoene dehydrogenase [Bacteroidetes bacterium HGW-Bacteroidetes-17]